MQKRVTVLTPELPSPSPWAEDVPPTRPPLASSGYKKSSDDLDFADHAWEHMRCAQPHYIAIWTLNCRPDDLRW